MPEDKKHRRLSIRTTFELVGGVTGLLFAYLTRNSFGFEDTVSACGFAVLAAIAGALLASGLFGLIYSADKTPSKETKDQGKDSREPDEGHFRTIRETAESIVIALILAFLFRSFEAEAFVIPTGSMAPTLQGRHKDLIYPDGGVEYRTGASIENEDSGARRGIIVVTHDPLFRRPLRVEYGFDDRTGMWKPIKSKDYPDGDERRDMDLRSFNGDRIIVSKFIYEFSDPQRWDVIVFKYPGNPKQNYIKRLVGLPDETIRIFHGDIFVVHQLFSADHHFAEALDRGELSDELRSLFKRQGIDLPEQVEVREVSPFEFPRQESLVAEWQIRDTRTGTDYHIRESHYEDDLIVYSSQIAQKSPRKLRAMLQRVDDTRYLPPDLIKMGWPSRWQRWQSPDSPGENPWEKLDDGRSFKITASEGKADDMPIAWLRYQHFMPSWTSSTTTDPPPDRPGQLITDYYAYNDSNPIELSQLFPAARIPGYPNKPKEVSERPEPIHGGLHWVGDLAVEADVTVENKQGHLWLQLVEGGHFYRCRINLADGTAVLSIDDGQVPFVGSDSAEGPIELVATTEVTKPGRYRLRFANCDNQLVLWVNDRVQQFHVGKGSQPVEATYANNVECRPFYSKNEPGDLMPVGLGSQGVSMHVARLRVLRDIYYIAHTGGTPLTDYGPGWRSDVIQEIFQTPTDWATTDLFKHRGVEEFLLGADQFFPLGDNSPASKDGRLWDPPTPKYVERRFLTGKALFIYWPHSWDWPVPFWPNFRRMGFVR